MEEQKYYIVCTKAMEKEGQIFLLWGPNFLGYTTNADEAGKYTLKAVRAMYGDEFPVVVQYITFYEDMPANFLIPADDADALKKIGLRKVAVITYL